MLDALGYNPRHAEGLTSVTSVVGSEKGYRLRVDEMSAVWTPFSIKQMQDWQLITVAVLILRLRRASRGKGSIVGHW